MENAQIKVEAQRLTHGFESAHTAAETNHFREELQRDVKTMTAENYGLLLTSMVALNKSDIGKDATLPELRIIENDVPAHVAGIEVVHPTAEIVNQRHEEADKQVGKSASEREHADVVRFKAQQDAEKKQFCEREAKSYQSALKALHDKDWVGRIKMATGLVEAGCPQRPRSPNGGWNVV